MFVKEICSDLTNVRMVPNIISKIDLVSVFRDLLDKVPYKKQSKFSYENTVKLEENLIKS